MQKSNDITYAHFVSLMSSVQLPDNVMKDIWDRSEFMTIPANTIFGNGNTLSDKLFFMYEGCAVDYPPSINSEKLIHRLIQPPVFITVSMFSKFLHSEPYFTRESITTIKGIAWDLDYILNLADEYPTIYVLFCQALGRIILSQSEAQIVSSKLNSLEKYKWFLEQYPNLINFIPLKYVASFLNMRPETLSRVRAEIMQT